VKNIFFVSHYGQIIQCNQFIRANGLQNNELAILYTPKNKIMPRMVEKAVDRKLFQRVDRYKLPTGCMTTHIGRIMRMRKKYKNFLRQHQPTDIYVFSFEGHYVLLEELAAQQGIRVHLIEEGTATYKLAVPDYREITPKSFSQATAETFAKSSASKNPIILGLIALARVPVDLYDFLKRFYVQERTQSALLNLFPRKWRAYKTTFRKFDSIHAAFPEVLKTHFPDMEIKPYFVHEQSSTSLSSPEAIIARDTVRQYGITSKDSLFVSQRYGITLDILVPHIVRALEKTYNQFGHADGRLFVKLHPKESDQVKASYRNAPSKLNGRLVVIESQPFPVEALIAQTDIGALIGISSSSLVYAHKLKPDMKIISIGNYLSKEIRKYPAERIALSQMDAHMSLLKQFPHIHHT
jgi:hypothetical protein